MAKDDEYLSEFCRLFDPAPAQELLPYCETATVISEPPNIEVKTRDLTYRADQIEINEYWTPGHEREIEIPTTTITGSDSDGDSHNSGGIPYGKIIFKDGLKVGDKVACLQSRSKQTLYVLFRLAR